MPISTAQPLDCFERHKRLRHFIAWQLWGSGSLREGCGGLVSGSESVVACKSSERAGDECVVVRHYMVRLN